MGGRYQQNSNGGLLHGKQRHSSALGRGLCVRLDQLGKRPPVSHRRRTGDQRLQMHRPKLSQGTLLTLPRGCAPQAPWRSRRAATTCACGTWWAAGGCSRSCQTSKRQSHAWRSVRWRGRRARRRRGCWRAPWMGTSRWAVGRGMNVHHVVVHHDALHQSLALAEGVARAGQND